MFARSASLTHKILRPIFVTQLFRNGFTVFYKKIVCFFGRSESIGQAKQSLPGQLVLL